MRNLIITLLLIVASDAIACEHGTIQFDTVNNKLQVYHIQSPDCDFEYDNLFLDSIKTVWNVSLDYPYLPFYKDTLNYGDTLYLELDCNYTVFATDILYYNPLVQLNSVSMNTNAIYYNGSDNYIKINQPCINNRTVKFIVEQNNVEKIYVKCLGVLGGMPFTGWFYFNDNSPKELSFNMPNHALRNRWYFLHIKVHYTDGCVKQTWRKSPLFFY